MRAASRPSSLVLPPAHGSHAHPRARPWFHSRDPGSQTRANAARAGQGRNGDRESAGHRQTHHGGWHSRNRSRRPNHSGPDAELLFVTGAGWTKNRPTARRHRAGGGKLIRNFLQLGPRRWAAANRWWTLAARPGRAVVFVAPDQIGQTGSTPRHPRRVSTCFTARNAHGRLAFHQRSAAPSVWTRTAAGRRQSRRALRGRRLRRDGKSERAARGGGSKLQVQRLS